MEEEEEGRKLLLLQTLRAEFRQQRREEGAGEMSPFPLFLAL